MRLIGCRSLFVLALFAAVFSCEVDLALAKNIQIRENMRIEFRAETFNIFNHPNFGLPGQLLFSGINSNGNGIPNLTAGQITNSISTARQMQFALRFRF